MPTHAEPILIDPTPSIEPASGTDRAHGEHRRRRRRRSKPVTPGRVAKFVVLGILALVGLVLFTAEFLRSASLANHMSADQEQACAKAYKNGDTRLAAVACEQGNWQPPH